MALTGFLIAFIPLYPKLPLAELITGYIVRVRLEDIVVALAAVLWFVQVLRKKITVKTPLTWMISAYLIVGFISSISAIYWTATVPINIGFLEALNLFLKERAIPPEFYHVAKLFLHYFRRIEYFSLFFVAFASIKKRKHVVVLLSIFSVTALLVSVYGFGQKYLYWPVYSTMNREFSKGLRLYLTEHARVQSTFGGHYDFAAYLVIALPLTLALFFAVKSIKIKLTLAAAFLSGLWGLMMTSSRSSFIAYFAAITLVLIAMAWKRGILWFLSRALVVYICTFSFFFLFGDISTRFAQVLRVSPSFVQFQQMMEGWRLEVQKPLVEAPKNAISIDDVTKAAQKAQEEEAARALAAAKKKKPTPAPVIDVSDTQPSPEKPTATLPPDVFVDVPAKVIATKSASGKTIQIIVPRVFSENAHKLGLSVAIRLDTLWPFAINGFLRNPLLGSGYSTLTKYTNEQFTEAESTDNDFLRTLGETGALGFITFYGTMIAALVYVWKKSRQTHDELLGTLSIALTAVTLGLFINATYIDVFVSSKVIQTYWLLTGIILAYAGIVGTQTKMKPVKKKV